MSDKQPATLAAAQAGDRIVLRCLVGFGRTAVSRLFSSEVSKAGKKTLTTHGVTFRRDGTPMVKKAHHRLLNPTPDVLAELQTWLDKDAAKSRQQREAREAQYREQARRARVAAEWLTELPNSPNEVVATFSEQLLNDVYDELAAKGKLAETPDDQAHPAPV